MNAPDNFTTMTNLIAQSRHCITLLKESLQTESDYLRDNMIKELIPLSQQKEILMLELHSLDQQRKHLTTENNITSKKGYLLWLEKLDPGLALQKSWLSLSEEILDCQQKNTRNGIISESMANASRTALNIVSGNTAPVETTYTAKGKKPDPRASLHNITA
ncbi:MAG: flagellar protein FlgN [Gammaproteobacteria bacterium]|nr:flagellar protein FlgN [Gammaproteobacteria bacterium]